QGMAAAAPSPDATNLADMVTTTILQCLAQSLKISAYSIDCSEPFSDYGLDSILGISLVKKLNDSLGINLNTAILFDHATVDKLARHIVTTHGDRIRATGATAPTGPTATYNAPSTVPATQAEERQL